MPSCVRLGSVRYFATMRCAVSLMRSPGMAAIVLLASPARAQMLENVRHPPRSACFFKSRVFRDGARICVARHRAQECRQGVWTNHAGKPGEWSKAQTCTDRLRPPWP